MPDMNKESSCMVPSTFGSATGRVVICLLTAAATGAAVMLAGHEPSANAAGKNRPAGEAQEPVQVNRTDLVNDMLGLVASEIITVNVDPTPDRNIWAPITIDGLQYTMDLEPHSIRAPGYILRAQLADGSFVDVDPGPLRTLRGSLDEVPGSEMRASLLEDGLHGSVLMPDGERWWFEPLAGRLPEAAADEYVLYRGSDVLPSGGTCGTNDVVAVPDLPAVPNEEGAPGGGIAGAQVFCTELGIDADFEYYQAYGSSVVNVQNRINQVINQMDIQYVNQVDIDHVITAIIVRTAEPDPYSSAVAGTLLNQFRNEWLANQGAIPRDVAQLFTGKNVSAASGGTIGIAFTIGGICTSSGYCLVQSDCCGGLACATDLSSHELGHLWGASHCIPGTSSTMNPSITCVNTFLGCNPDTVAAIVAHRNSRTCLSACADATLPFFDAFPSTTIDPAKWSTIVNGFSNTLGQNEPSAPNSLNIKGGSGGGSQVRTSRMDTSGVTNLQISYMYQQRGGGDDPETNDNLVIEYFNDVGNWVQLLQHFGSDPVLTTYTPVTMNLGDDAKHSEFRLRFRNTSAQTNLDDWLVDDVSIIASPVNDSCTTAALLEDGSHPYTTVAASTDGPDESGCGAGQLNNDIWFLYGVACAPATVTVSTCGSTFDTRLAAYMGICPGGPGSTIACNDNFCGDDAEISFHVNDPVLLVLRLGGATTATGTGNLVITCTPDGPGCSGDTDNSGAVNIDDLLFIINNWGTSNPTADIDDDGDVDIDDLLGVINNWGSC